ncbi:MAG: aromatic ring-hydroxylating dioxygenase subunit alpha [Aquisalimonadaceae bacterium]
MDELVEKGRVHRRLYVDPLVFEKEMERIYYGGWVFVCHESEISEPGDYKTSYIGRQPVILSRHSNGQIYVLLNRCMHRGAQVCQEGKGNTRAFRCLYHGWAYDNKGDLLVVPFPEGYGEDFDTSKLGLRAAPCVESYRGFVFASLNPDVGALRECMGPAADVIDLIVDAAPGGEIEVGAGVQKYVYYGNWKLQIENWVDGYHPSFTHQSAFALMARKTGAKPSSQQGSVAKAVSIPNGHALLDFTGSPRAALPSGDGDAEYQAALESRYGRERAREVRESDVQILVFPNLFIQSNGQHFRVVRPISVDKTEVHAYPYALKGGSEEQNRRMASRLGWWASAAGFGQPDDLEAFERCQEGLRIESAEWLLFSRGLHREQRRADGSVVGDVTDEVTQRGIYEEWKARMTDGR